MKVVNIHERFIAQPRGKVGALIDTLASKKDALWPRTDWPPMKFDRPLAVGAHGGHGPIRYFVESYEPGANIRFRFTGPRGFNGWHGLEAITQNDGALLRHTIEMRTSGRALLTWPLMFRPLHDALIEDALSQAQESLGIDVEVKPWSLSVRILRRLAGARPRHKRTSVP